jgi:hypothetical protein
MICSPEHMPGGVRLVMATSLVAMTTLTAPGQSAGRPELAPDQIRAAFVRAGYAASQPSPWDDRTVSLMLHEPSQAPADRPALRVFVFVDTAAATAEHRRAHAREESRRNGPLEHSDDLGPQLLSGYGASVWRRNVALVQASPDGDLSTFPTEPTCPPESVFTVDTTEVSGLDDMLPAIGVDRRFVELLEGLP